MTRFHTLRLNARNVNSRCFEHAIAHTNQHAPAYSPSGSGRIQRHPKLPLRCSTRALKQSLTVRCMNGYDAVAELYDCRAHNHFHSDHYRTDTASYNLLVRLILL